LHVTKEKDMSAIRIKALIRKGSLARTTATKDLDIRKLISGN